MRLFRRKKRVTRPVPPWLYWTFLVLLLYGVTTTLRKGPNAPTPMEIALEKVSKIDPEKLLPIEQYKNIVFPAFTASLDIKDVKQGKGMIAICGQDVNVRYSSTIVGIRPLDASQTLTFRIGGGTAVPALEQGVTGMRPGGKRSLISTLNMSYGIKKFARPDEHIPADAHIDFEVEMLSATPALPDVEATPYRIATTVRSNGTPIFCGETARFQMTLWGVDGKKLYASKEPESFTPGKSEVFLGLEQGVIGMTRGSMRTLVVPPQLQNTMRGNTPALRFPLPKTQTVLVDVEALP